MKCLSRGIRGLCKTISCLQILARQVHWQVEGGAKPQKGELMRSQFILIGVNLRSSRHTNPDLFQGGAALQPFCYVQLATQDVRQQQNISGISDDQEHPRQNGEWSYLRWDWMKCWSRDGGLVAGLALQPASCVVFPGKEAAILQKSRAQQQWDNKSAMASSADPTAASSAFRWIQTDTRCQT